MEDVFANTQETLRLYADTQVRILPPNPTKHFMTVKEHIEKFGGYATARKLLAKKVSTLGVELEDLPDTAELADISEELADALENEDTNTAKEILNRIDIDWLLSNSF